MLGLLLILFQALIIFFFDGFTWVRNTQINLGHIIYALISFLAISLYEELLFRGYAFQWAVRGLGNTTALLLFGLFFVIAHLDNPGMTGGTLLLGSLNIGLASVLLGLAWIRTKSLALPVGIHLGWNWTQGSLLGFGVSGEKSQGYWAPVFNDLPHWFTGGDFGLEASLPCTAVCLIMCICFVLWKSKNMRIIAVPHQNRVPRL
ncbi:MAG: CPBP family intramembrane metalloprotease [Holophagales bacterium]|nr:CPBP family intramembrane metalloprotease [Holophagales bacterium]